MVKRVSDEPAYVVHRYDWSETSLILEVLTRRHGRIALAAKGVKRPTSGFRSVLLPLQPLRIAFGGDGEIRTLKAAEWSGGEVMPSGEPLMSGYYLNELVMRLLARDDPHPLLFDAYAATVGILAGGDTGAMQLAMRAFELLLLREVGLLPALDHQSGTLAELDPEARYVLVAEGGLREAQRDDRAPVTGRDWQALQRALELNVPYTATLQAAAACAAELKLQLRALLNYHCGVKVLRTQQVMMDLQSL